MMEGLKEALQSEDRGFRDPWKDLREPAADPVWFPGTRGAGANLIAGIYGGIHRKMQPRISRGS